MTMSIIAVGDLRKAAYKVQTCTFDVLLENAGSRTARWISRCACAYLRRMSSDRLILRFDLAGIRQAAAEFWSWSRPQRVISFAGGLGAGKTTFIHALCDSLGVTDAVSSPTFALINEYELPGDKAFTRILHMDWYRLKDTDEAINAGMEDALSSDDAICFVEWPGQAPELLEIDHIAVSIQIGEHEGERVLEAVTVNP